MFSNEKIRPYIFAFLAFCVVSSKHIIIYNEEILVALSFFSFIVFVSHYFGNSIKESLDERAFAIKTELQNFLNIKHDSLIELFQEYQKLSTINSSINHIGSFTFNELLSTSSRIEKAFYFIVSQQIQQKLKTLSQSKLSLQQKLQPLMALNLLSMVLVKVLKKKQKSKGKIQLNPKVIQEALQLLKKTSL
jgi:Mitochondrial ATP synthase B chain precursor (ATP-synt_B)